MLPPKLYRTIYRLLLVGRPEADYDKDTFCKLETFRLNDRTIHGNTMDIQARCGEH